MREDLIERMAEVLPPKPIGENPLSFVVTPVHAAEMHNRFARLAAAIEAAREDACVALVADIRFACGDNGKRMQPELVEFIRGLAEDAERYRWLKAHDNAYLLAEEVIDDQITIDQARGKAGGEVGGGR